MLGLTLEYMSFHCISAAVGFKIFKCWATMYGLSTFDTKYSQSIEEHPIRTLVGKKICCVYRRSMHHHEGHMMKALEDKDEHEVEQHDQEFLDPKKEDEKA